jgi:hypothetical protein
MGAREGKALKISKDQTITVSVSSIVSVVAGLGSVWMFAGPIAERALAGEIQEQIAPLTDAFTLILTQNIANQRAAITAMRFKRDMCAGAVECWTLRDAQDLDAAERTLRSMEQALERMQQQRQ